jgi:hypothetical protein
MENSMRVTIRCVVVLLLVTAIVPIGSAQAPGAGSRTNAREPQPEDAIRATIAAFDTFRIVAIGDLHNTRDLNNFVLSLVRHPAFPNAVNDIVVEGNNSLLQPTLDRYIAGEDVPIADARRLWRDNTVAGGGTDFQAQLFQLIRRINQKLPMAKRLRVLAGEPPVDWSTVTPEIYQRQVLEQRYEHIAVVMEKEVLAKNRKALMFYGGAHVRHGTSGMAVERYERKHPGVTFVIFPYYGVAGFGQRCGSPAAFDGATHETEMTSWPVPSLVRTKGTWLADLAKSPRPLGVGGVGAQPSLGASPADPIDAYLYLGPPSLLLSEQPSAYVFTDNTWRAELQRRQVAAGLNAYADTIDPDKVRERDSDVLQCKP